MPTGTFFRLPEEKKQRLIEAAWREFTRTKLTETSINRIIQDAGIPRGSFYQYFKDKDDLLQYLIGDIKLYFTMLFRGELRDSGGNIFSVPLKMYDKIIKESGEINPEVQRCMDFGRLNPGIDLQSAVLEVPDRLRETFDRYADTSLMRQSDQQFLDRLYGLLVKITASAVIGVLMGMQTRETARRNLETDMGIIQYGSFCGSGVSCAAANGRNQI
ncbi:MAG: TetR/AcrR family transcriptional regulator [Candidatus Heteroscillospira sp.]|jgi:AcrR family transcriptional regulator